MKSVRLLFVSVAAFATVGAAALAPSARAEDVVLTSGARYDAKSLEWDEGSASAEGRVKFTYAVGGGSVTLDFPMSRIDPWSLFALKSARTPSKDGAAQLELARFAAAHGLRAEAVRRYQRAAQLDPSLSDARDAGLRAVEDAALEKDLAQAERDLNRGRSDLALASANDVVAKADPAGTLVARAKTLGALASRMLESDRARLALEAKARDEAAVAATAQAFASGLVRADKAIRGALADRARAGDATIGATEATRILESAESQLREGRRVLAATRASAGDRVAEVDGRDREALPLLVATQIDLADLYRQQRRFDKARDFLRAAQVLDPDNGRVKEIRELVERDLNAPPLEAPAPDPFDAYGGFTTGTYYGGAYYPGLGLSSPYPTGYVRPRAYGTPGFRGYSGSGFGYRFGSGFGFRFRW